MSEVNKRQNGRTVLPDCVGYGSAASFLWLFAVSHCRSLRGGSGVLDKPFCSDYLPVTPWGNFLCEQKVTKESFRRRGLRFPRLLKTSTLEPPKRNRARFPFDFLQRRAMLQLSSAVFCTKFVFAKIAAGNVKHRTTPQGVPEGGSQSHFCRCG